MLRYGYVMAWGLGGVGAITFMLLAISSGATLGLCHGLGFGWGGGNNVYVTCNLK